MTDTITRTAPLALPLRPLFIATILLGSFLLFLIQPMFGRLVLPVLGGSPQVWNTAMLFYQAALLGGYLYAHALSRLAVRRQLLVHLGVFALAALTLPIGIARWYPAAGTGDPTLWLIGLLASSIGPVFFAVSAQAPLMQAWFARSGDRDAANPYFLYAASNVGSFGGLIAYPFLVEPRFRLGEQSWGWSFGFVALAALVGLCGLAVGRGDPAVTAPGAAAAARVSWAQRGRWTLLAFVASGLLLSTTTHLTTDIMAMPLLWVIPLSAYLLSFVAVFSARGPLFTRIAVFTTPLLLLLTGSWACLSSGPAQATGFAVAGILLLLSAAVALHGTLAAERPAPEALTDFYLWMSVGGALGGVFCALVAPVIFDWPFEHPLLLLAVALLVPARPIGPLATRLLANPLPRIVAAALAALIAWWAVASGEVFRAEGMLAVPPRAAIVALALIALFAIGRRLLFTWLLVLMMVVLGGWNQLTLSGSGARTRSFFGVYTVEDRRFQQYKVLMHGTTMHGLQSDIVALKNLPMTYYAPDSGVGKALRATPRLIGPGARIGFVGLGTGTLACYFDPGQSWTAYEIDPAVEHIARTQFSYISRCNPDLKVVIGDARLTLAAAAPAAHDVLAVDAFSSDAIPLHLVTAEAFAVYGRALAPEGLLLIHISNRFLDLEPVIAAIAREGGWTAIRRDYRAPEARMQPDGQYFSGSNWIALSRSPAVIARLSREGEWLKLRARADVPTWHDDFASVLPVVRLRED